MAAGTGNLKLNTYAGPYVAEAMGQLSESDIAFLRERSPTDAKRSAEFKSLRVIVSRWRDAYADPAQRPRCLISLVDRHEKGKKTDAEMHARLVRMIIEDPDADHSAGDADLRPWAYLLREFQSFDFGQISDIMRLPRSQIKRLYWEAYRVIHLDSGQEPEALGA